MDEKKREELSGLLTVLPPVEFCCVYGSTLHPNNHDQSRMIDYILGVRDPVEWHLQNLKMNRNHFASWMANLGGAKLITGVADKVGVGVHFNPFVSWNNKTFKYGVVRMHDLVEDILNWETFYLSGRLQKPVHVLVDNLDVENLNSFNLRAATSAALLLLPSKFTQEDLYTKICSLSYNGDLRMLFAEDMHKVRKIVQGQFDLFRGIYKPVLEEFATKDLLRFSSSGAHQNNIIQDCDLPAVQSLFSRLPKAVRNHMSMNLGDQQKLKSGQDAYEAVIKSRAEAANCLEKILRRKVMVSSIRQAIAGVLTVGAVRATRYLSSKMNKAWKSWL
ncbi:phosphatidate cytidylyltransferase, mitochondrial-like isoform X1 [Chenopodium quinoa]|uniref:Phosphatidate cytidylyltransferase, mitochondrial n=2 Tax=Chenopodium quinoa TaxID=63459 RepID=A0A803MXJ0_CHEQI|nr:phosphatidate cytidylyltransferase, mitochondrial-like isoform X1 [Chenopodium quinoa]